ncbi:hypothetical protein BACCAP_02371 [Pseudoflavonifractor capillosus ATCC 29799]|uniref:Uncharacterized protein n=1 Tax=Pseudoflavonifractor capillosus ATCC 29799 TaxID=411467 RepID=A6NVX7_9FIRM|nr:hypothetical protein BACCAP_02371 [Pseudoflavonifractor capillosus ATCC 29799]
MVLPPACGIFPFRMQHFITAPPRWLPRTGGEILLIFLDRPGPEMLEWTNIRE